MRIDVRAWPIAVKIGWAISLTMLAGGLIASILVQSAIRRAQTEVIQGDFRSLSEVQTERVVEALTREISVLVTLAHDEEVMAGGHAGPATEAANAAADHLLSFMQVFPQFKSLVLTATDGQIVAATYTSITFNYQRTIWWQSAYADGQGAVYLSSPVTDPSSGSTGVQIAIPVRDEETGETIGVLMAVWDFDLARQALIAGASQHTMILDSYEQRALADTTLEGIEAIRLPEQVSERFFTEQAGAFSGPDEEGVATIFGYSSLSAWAREIEIGSMSISSALRNLGWSIVVREPTEEALAGIAPLTRQLQALIAASVILAILFAMVILRGAMAPLHDLTVAAAQIGEGVMDTPVPKLPLDEVGRLAGVLREMVAKLSHRQEQLSAAARISRTAMLSLEMDQMLGDTLQSLGRSFGYSEAQVYLIDSAGRQAHLRAGVGPESGRLLDERHRLAVNETTLVGRAILLDEPQVEEARQAAPGEPQPAARAAAAVPLRAADRPLGALYVAAGKMARFEPGDGEVLRLVADQFSASLENVRLYEQSQAALAEIEALNRRLTRTAWEERLTGGGQLRHTLDPDGRWPKSLEEARRRSEAMARSYTDSDGRTVLAAPIVLRGEAIGSIGVTRPAGYHWSSDEVALVEAIAARVAMIAESIRLVDESTRVAQREQIISSVSERLQRAVDVDTLVMTALDELGEALGTGQVSLRIGPPPVDSDRRLTSSQPDGTEAEGGSSPDDG
jgi:GAF domain-containing protein/HAMP domain-containing protein